MLFPAVHVGKWDSEKSELMRIPKPITYDHFVHAVETWHNPENRCYLFTASPSSLLMKHVPEQNVSSLNSKYHLNFTDYEVLSSSTMTSPSRSRGGQTSIEQAFLDNPDNPHFKEVLTSHKSQAYVMVNIFNFPFILQFYDISYFSSNVFKFCLTR